MTGPDNNTHVDENEVELCMELARMYDTEDLTHPPLRRGDSDDEKQEKED